MRANNESGTPHCHNRKYHCSKFGGVIPPIGATCRQTWCVKNGKHSDGRASRVKRGWLLAVLFFTNLCLSLDRVGRIFDAREVVEIAIAVFQYISPIISAYFFLLEWLIQFLTWVS